LGALDAQGGILGHQHRGRAVVGQAQASGEQTVIGGAGVEDLGEAIVRHPIGLDPQRAPRRQGDGLAQAARP
jgi:hypothetical protein